MRRRWIADTFSPATGHPTHAALTGGQAFHLARVLRAEIGQSYDVVAAGFLHRAEITSISEDHIGFVLHEELEADSALSLHLYLAVFKFDHFEWAVEKSTELGVGAITPILARRTEKHLAQAAVKRVERWRRIAHEASQQSRRTSVPVIADPLTLKSALPEVDSGFRILLSETEQANTLADALEGRSISDPAQALRGRPCDPTHRDETAMDGAPQHRDLSRRDALALAIGPEGGWTAEEMVLFTEYHWMHVTLGPRILRAETAAIAAIAIAGSYLAS